MKKLLYSALVAVALIAGIGTLGLAANITVSTGAHFVPTGPALTKGSDLNVLVDKINAINNGTITGNPVLLGNAANKVSVTAGATTVDPVITVGGTGSDTNIGLLVAGKGTGPLHLGGTDKTNGSVRIPTVTSAVNAVDLEGAATLGIPFITVGGLSSDTNAAIALYGKGTGAVLVGGVTTTLAGLQVAQTASAVNDLLITNGATGTPVALSAASAGADTNVGITITGKGTGAILIGGATTTLAGLQVAQTASRVNDIVITPGATGTNALLASNTAGSDTNAGLDITPKGSGVVKVGGTIATCSGTTTATCQGQRIVVSVTGLTTAASTLAATMTVTDAAVVSSSSIVMCQTQTYAGTGVPVVVNVTPGTGSVAFGIQNVSTGAALNATVPVACFVFGT